MMELNILKEKGVVKYNISFFALFMRLIHVLKIHKIYLPFFKDKMKYNSSHIVRG